MANNSDGVEVTKKEKDSPAIDYETLRKRGGIYREKEVILKAFLKSEMKEGTAHPFGKGEAGLARFIASKELLYKKVNDRFILLNANSITTYLRNMKQSVTQEIAQEKEEKKREKQRKSPFRKRR